MKAHIKNMHMTTGAGKLLCTACGRTYESKTSYTAHYTNNQCLKVIIPGMIQDYDDDPQNDLEGDVEGDEEQETVPEGEGEGEATEFSDISQPNSVPYSGCFSHILYIIPFFGTVDLLAD